MKKAIKMISLLAALILALSMFSGCTTSGDGSTGEDELEVLSITVGIPVDSSDPEWSEWEPVLTTWIDDFLTYYQIDLSFTKIPTEEKEWKKFMRKVENGKIACFFSSRGEFIETMIEDEIILSMDDVRATYTAVLEETPAGILSLAAEDDLINYMYPIYGTYQGLYYNRTLFKELGLENPTSWDSILAAIEVLKEKGYTPIAAGFADEGLEYMIDEMILSEGGTAEHSYQPTFGVVSSWERAVADIKTLEGLGAFTADCYNVTFEEAVESFLNGEAAMIVAPSDSFGGNLPADDVKVVGFPKTPTGKREDGAFIGNIDYGVYVGEGCFYKKNTRYAEAVVELLGSDYFGSGDFYNLLKDESTFTIDPMYYSDYRESYMDDALQSLVTNATAADWPMRDRALTMDTTVECFRKALTGTDVTTALQEATNAEIAAAEAAEAEE